MKPTRKRSHSRNSIDSNDHFDEEGKRQKIGSESYIVTDLTIKSDDTRDQFGRDTAITKTSLTMGSEGGKQSSKGSSSPVNDLQDGLTMLLDMNHMMRNVDGSSSASSSDAELGDSDSGEAPVVS